MKRLAQEKRNVEDKCLLKTAEVLGRILSKATKLQLTHYTAKLQSI